MVVYLIAVRQRALRKNEVPSTATCRHFHTAPAKQDYIRPAGCCLVSCPKCGAAVGDWCFEKRKTPNGHGPPLHDERYEAAWKYGSVGWQTFRHTYCSWLDSNSTSEPIGAAAEIGPARTGSDHDERVRKALLTVKREGNSKVLQSGIEERLHPCKNANHIRRCHSDFGDRS